MVKTFIYAMLLVCCSFLIACQSNKGPSEEVLAMEPCEKASALAEAYKTGFEAFKGAYRSKRTIGVWAATTHMVGNQCEIWEWANGNVGYVCEQAMPDEEAASAGYLKAKDQIAQCLGDEWELTEEPRENVTGMRSVFRPRDGQSAAFMLHMVSSKVLYKSEWTLVLGVGDDNQRLHPSQ